MKLDKKNIFDIYPLTEVQHGILFESFKDGLDKTYAVQLFLGYDFLLDNTRFVEAWKKIFTDNELLRAVVRWKQISKPILVILDDVNDRIKFQSRNNVVFNGFKSYAEVHCVEPIKIEKEVFTVTLHHINNHKSLVEIRSHHLIQDGWSTSILINEFVKYYLAENDTRPPKTLFKEYISFVQSQKTNQQSQYYWSAHLQGVEPTRLIENTGKVFSEDKYVRSFDSDFHYAIRRCATEHSVSLPTILHLGWAMALSDYQSQNDVVFGSVVSGRPAHIKGIDHMVGNFINTLPCRICFNPELSVREALQELQNNMSARTEFDWQSVGEIKQIAGIDLNSNLFDSVLIIENYPFNNAILYGEKFKASYAEMKESASYPLDISIRLLSEIEVDVKFHSDKISAETVSFLIGSFKNALSFILLDSEVPIVSYSAITAEEKFRILKEFNKPVNVDILPAKSIATLFDDQVFQRPEVIALVSGDVKLTYLQLQKSSNALARKLKNSGVRKGEVIGVYTTHNVSRIISLLAILKSEAVFLPIRLKEPLENVHAAMGACASTKLLVEPIFVETFYNSALFADTTLISTDTHEDYEKKAIQNVSFDRVASIYILMTSGSTGTPKAVLVDQQNLLNTIQWFIREYDIKPGTRILQLTDYTFDPSFEDIFGGLIAGAEIHLPTLDVLSDSRACYNYLHENEINIINYVPSVLYEILGNREKVNSIQVVISGGEELSETIMNELLNRGYTLYNNYGPTETTIDCLFSKCDVGKVNLGRPITNAYCLLLDVRNRLTPINRVGEICIGGLGVSPGYLNNPSLTAEKFIADPFNPGQRLYKTGDFGKWQEDGTIVYMGRRDSQVKINGIRVELGAIKSTINKINEVLQSEVLVAGPGKRLVAFIQCKMDQFISEEGVVTFLSKSLAPHMIPKAVIFLDKFPLTANGKTDGRELLRIYNERKTANVSLAHKRVSSYSASLISIWGTLLEIDDVDPDKSFFELGGDSFGLMKCVNRVNEYFKIDLPISTFFSYPTITLLGQHIQNIKEDKLAIEATPTARFEEAKERLLLIRKNR
jgi:amino acid adenylation domain-containing protein